VRGVRDAKAARDPSPREMSASVAKRGMLCPGRGFALLTPVNLATAVHLSDDILR